MAINAGKLRHVVRIDVRQQTQDENGEIVFTWRPFASPRRAELVANPGREFWEAQAEQRQGRVPTVFRLRYLPGVVPSMRLIYRRDDLEKLFNILSATDPDGRRVELVLTTEELVEVQP